MPWHGLDEMRKKEKLIMPRFIGPSMVYIPFVKIDKEAQTINLCVVDKNFK